VFQKICPENYVLEIFQKKQFGSHFLKRIKQSFSKMMGAGRNLLGCRKKKISFFFPFVTIWANSGFGTQAQGKQVPN